MSGLLRNLLVFLRALFAQGSVAPQSRVHTHFWVTPFDSGLSVLKSDKYFQFAESAEIDYLLKTGKLFALARAGVRFVNVSQLVKFSLPIRVFSRVRVETELVFADTKCAYFSHALHVGAAKHGEVLVKMKFKKGRLTVPPSDVLPHRFVSAPPAVQRWEPVLEAM